jgi:transcriptional regulator with GAF, ATPase, and Fis domain
VASLIARLPDGDRRYDLVKTVTSIGRDPQNDVQLDDPGLETRHAHVLKDKKGFRLFAAAGAKVLVNGKRRSEWPLEDGDRLQLGGLELTYRAAGAPAVPPMRASSAPDRDANTLANSDPAERVRLEAFQRLFAFSDKVGTSPTLADLKRNLVDAVIELANADTGFLILLSEWGTKRIDVARDRQGNDLPADGARLSDSIIADVVAKRRPILLSDALADTIFGGSHSVVNFRIRTVFAVPIVRGDNILGVLYLGSDRVTPNFTPEFQEGLMVFAAQAGLLIENAMLVESLRADNRALKEALARDTFGEIIGGCPQMQGIFRAVARLAPADISTLILGETGTGKELIAREIHRRSGRADGPFVPINVAAIPENLLESELFGYVRGAFTGAISDRKGKLAAAHGGTLFLDEIGDMPLGLQAKLLRVLQDRKVEPIGSNVPLEIDVRVVSATHRDLAAMQEEGSFRADLYYRLAEAHIVLPPLCERGDDIALLANYFLTRFNEKLGRSIRRFTPRAVARMRQYRWPGNVRELEAKVKHSVVMCEGHEIDVDDLGIREDALGPVLSLRDAKEAFARQYIFQVLELNDGNRTQTARQLDIDPRTVFKYVEGK